MNEQQMNQQAMVQSRSGSARGFDGRAAENARPDGAIGAEFLRLDRVIQELAQELAEHHLMVTPILSDPGVGLATMPPAAITPPREPATCQLEARLRESTDQIEHLTRVVRELSARVRL